MSHVAFQKGYFGVCNFPCVGGALVFLNYWNARKVYFGTGGQPSIQLVSHLFTLKM